MTTERPLCYEVVGWRRAVQVVGATPEQQESAAKFTHPRCGFASAMCVGEILPACSDCGFTFCEVHSSGHRTDAYWEARAPE